MSNKTKIGIFGVLMFATMMMLVPASLADIYASEKKYDRYYDKERHYIEDNYYDDSYKKKPAIVETTKELFVCENIVNVTEETPFFECDFNENIDFPAPPDSDQYVSCDIVDCPGIDESDFAVAVFKDVAISGDLSSTVPTPADLTKINFIVAEDEIDETINNQGSDCSAVDFADRIDFDKVVSEDMIVFYDICILYEGDCEGEIYPGEVKECTVKNFIHSGSIFTVPEDEE
ncbi:MAG: hypothetical protein ACPKPY_04115 [Nitrososphaeraceae archaeon]